MLFELRNAAAERVSHCGVLEFIAEEGMIYMPYWVGCRSFLTDKNIVDSIDFCCFNSNCYCLDDGESALTRGRYRTSEKCDTSKGNIC